MIEIRTHGQNGSGMYFVESPHAIAKLNEVLGNTDSIRVTTNPSRRVRVFFACSARPLSTAIWRFSDPIGIIMTSGRKRVFLASVLVCTGWRASVGSEPSQCRPENLCSTSRFMHSRPPTWKALLSRTNPTQFDQSFPL